MHFFVSFNFFFLVGICLVSVELDLFIFFYSLHLFVYALICIEIQSALMTQGKMLEGGGQTVKVLIGGKQILTNRIPTEL